MQLLKFREFAKKTYSYEYSNFRAKKEPNNFVCTKFRTGKGIPGPVSLMVMKDVGRPVKNHKRINIRMDQEIYDALKIYCERNEVTLTEAIETGILFLLDSDFSPNEVRDFISD